MKRVAACMAFFLFAIPAQAQPFHETSVTHDGQRITLSYEPKIKTDLRQGGIGPRSAPTCFWKSQVSVQRIARDANGAPIEALTGAVSEPRSRSGMRMGMCNMAKISEQMAFGGDEAALRRFVVDAASNDASAVRRFLDGSSAERRAR